MHFHASTFCCDFFIVVFKQRLLPDIGSELKCDLEFPVFQALGCTPREGVSNQCRIHWSRVSVAASMLSFTFPKNMEMSGN